MIQEKIYNIAFDGNTFEKIYSQRPELQSVFEMDVRNNYIIFEIGEEQKCSELKLKKNSYFFGKDNDLLKLDEGKELLRNVLKRFLYEEHIDIFVKLQFEDENICHYSLEWFEEVEVLALSDADIKDLESKIDAAVRKLNKEKPIKKQLAMFTPLPPLKSGISDYSADIICELSNYMDIDVYIDEGYQVEYEFPNNVFCFSHLEFINRRDLYAEIIYQYGNSWNYHGYMLPYLRKYAGIVVLHDGNLHHSIYSGTVLQAHDFVGYKTLLLNDYEEQDINKYLRLLSRQKIQPELDEKWVNGCVVDYAKKTIVHNQFLLEKLLEKNIGLNVKQIPLYAKPQLQLKKEELKAKKGFDKADIILGTFGFVANTKKNLEILEAFLKLRMQNKNYKLVIVGGTEIDTVYNSRCQTYIRANHLEDCVMITGYVDAKVMEEYISICDICFNLRYLYKGESSATLSHILAQGKCVIVNDIGCFSEIPDNACVKLPYRINRINDDEIEELVLAVDRLQDITLREKIEENARRYAEEKLNIQLIGCEYYECILCPMYTSNMEDVIKKITDYVQHYNEEELNSLSEMLVYAHGV